MSLSTIKVNCEFLSLLFFLVLEIGMELSGWCGGVRPASLKEEQEVLNLSNYVRLRLCP